MDADQLSDDKVDEAVEETFPASDPPANTGETGIRIGPAPDPAALSHDDAPSADATRPTEGTDQRR